VFAGHVETCACDLRYAFWPGANQWCIAVAESAGRGGIAIGWCPHRETTTAPSKARSDEIGDAGSTVRSVQAAATA
jgi:hypothetical protein